MPTANLSRRLSSFNHRGSPTVNINIHNQATALVNIQSQPDASQANINPLNPYPNVSGYGMPANFQPNFPATALYANPHHVGAENFYQHLMPPHDAGMGYYPNMHSNEFMLASNYLYPPGYYPNMVHKQSHENDVKEESNVKSESFE